ncbi:uncharacterized protein LOC128219125 [Mya arenaria]|uniref:uncharacterized protein LOC128219125 n=1 Tax=Mya arenaria TaxID=6604 RepID=UPI0022E06DE3|nr:uncharacterized protein LOC128219125 [Mya arenaria]
MPRPVSTDYTIDIFFRSVTMSAASFGHFVSMVLKSRLSVEFKLLECKIGPEEDVTQLQVEMENQATLQRMDPRPVSTDYTIYFDLECVDMSAAAFRRFVSLVIQSGRSVNCRLFHCTIKPKKDVRNLIVEMENQAALTMTHFVKHPYKDWDITFLINVKDKMTRFQRVRRFFGFMKTK